LQDIILFKAALVKIQRYLNLFFRFQFRLLAALLLLLFFIFLLLLNPTFQDFSGDQVAAYLSRTWRTKVIIKGFRFQPMRTFSIEELYIEDHYGDTLLTSGRMELLLGNVRIIRQQIDVHSLNVYELDARLSRRAYENDFNFQFIVDFFSAPSPTDTSLAISPFKFSLGRLNMYQSAIRLSDDRREHLADRFDPYHFQLSEISVGISDIYASADSSAVNLHGLSFKESGGLEVQNAEFSFVLLPDRMRLQSLEIQTQASMLSGDVGLAFGSLTDFNHFAERVRFDLNLTTLRLSTSDMRRLAGPAAPQLPITLKGQVTGRINNLRGRDLQARLGPQTFISGQVSISGLPEAADAFYDLRLENSLILRNELLQAFPEMELPDQMQGLQFVRVRGSCFGYPNDFVAEGRFGTNLGSAQTDLNLKLRGPNSTYTGMLALEQLNLGQLTGDSSLGFLSLQTDIKGKGDQWANFESQLQGKITLLDYRQYRYTGIEVDGYLDRQTFTGKLASTDSNAHFQFFGLADLGVNPAFFNFVAEVDRLDLLALNLSKDTLVLSGYSEICIEGLDIDSISGELNFRNLDLQLADRRLSLDEINIVSAFDYDGRRRLNLESPVGGAYLTGSFSIKHLPNTFAHYFGNYINRNQQPALLDSQQFFEVNLDFSDAQQLADFVYPGRFDISRLSGHVYFNAETQESEMDFNLAYLRSNDFKFRQLNLFGSSNPDSLFIDVYADSLLMGETLVAQKISIENFLSNDLAGFEIRAMGEGSYNDLRVDGYFDFSADDLGLYFKPSAVRVYNNEWKLEQVDRISISPSFIQIPGISFKQGSQQISLAGVLSDRRSDTLRLRVKDVDLEQINPLLAITGTSMEGFANVDLEASSVLRKAAVTGNIDIQNFVLDGQPLGDLAVRSDYQTDAQVAAIHAELVQLGDTLVYITGTIGNLEGDQLMDLIAQTSNAPIHPLEKILSPVFTDVSGRGTAELQLRGSFNKPLLTGSLVLEKARLRVDFLNQYYTIDKRVVFTPTAITFDQAEISDDTGGKGRLNGHILHEHFRKTQLDLDLSAQNLLVLNTEPNFSDPYFGTGRLTGNATFRGPIDLVDIGIRATTERGTRFSIPLDADASRSSNDFIVFVNKDEPEVVVEERKFEVSGVNFLMNLTATPDAEFSIIFDRVAGDIIRGRGNANIELGINPQGDMTMFGNYTFTGGDYTFSLANIPSKRFRINDGSTIVWTGDPYDATLNLTAVYRQRASVAALLSEAQLNTGRTRTQMNVDTYLKLTGSLLQPTVQFEIKLPTINENDTGDPLVARIQNINNNEQELNNQVLALLVAGQFFPSDNLVSTSFLSSTGANSLTEVLSNQVNALLSQMFDNVNIGINYRSNNLGDATRNDITVALNTTFLNDRVVIDGNFGNNMTPGTTNAAVIGEVIIEYLITPDGTLRAKVFNKLDDRILVNRESNYRQGVGISYTENYNQTAELLIKPTRFVQDRFLRRIPWLPNGWKGDF
jgi:hypothetical protein